jgi:di/tricarboxylate transporter
LIRGGDRFPFPPATMLLAAGDVLRLRADVEKITAVQEREGITIRPHEKWESRQLSDGPTRQLEVIIAPSSELRGRTLKQARFADVFGGMALAIRQHGRLRHHELEDTRLQSGDALLVEVPEDRVAAFRRGTDFVLVSDVVTPVFRRRLILPALAIIGGVVALAAMGWVPILIGGLVGSVLMVLTGCLTLEEAYEAVDWKVIFLLAGVLTLGVAMENTGTAALLASVVVGAMGPLGPYAMVAAIYLLTTLLTSTMSNNATAVLLAPVAIAAAGSLGIDPRPLLMAVAFAASASFMTPMGYQTNLMIFSAGGFRFADFIRVGTPLNVLFFILATIFIPRFWAF